MNRMHVKIGILVFMTALAVVFVMQNLEAVEIRFLFWSFALSRALLVLIVLATGALAGWLASALWRRRPERPESTEPL
jgi:lipopolysaccharide assembly protein A